MMGNSFMWTLECDHYNVCKGIYFIASVGLALPYMLYCLVAGISYIDSG